MTTDPGPFRLIWIVLKILMSSVLVIDHLNGCPGGPFKLAFWELRSGLAGASWCGSLRQKSSQTQTAMVTGQVCRLHSAPAGWTCSWVSHFLSIITDYKPAPGELLALLISQEVGKGAHSCVSSTVKLNLLGYLRLPNGQSYIFIYISIYIYTYILF